jgi:hypothetical protein
MGAMFPAERAELFQLQPLRRGALVLCLAVVPVFALGALELNDFSWHLFSYKTEKVAYASGSVSEAS